MNTAEVVQCDGAHVWMRWHGSRGDREYMVPFGVPLAFRDGRTGALQSVEGTGEIALIRVEGRHPMRPLSFLGSCAVARDYQTSGKAQRGKRHGGAAAAVVLAPESITVTPTAVAVQAEIAGLPLEVVEGEWVTLRSLFEPFGKRVDAQLERISEWANLRKVRLPSRMGLGNSAGNLVSETWTIDRRNVAQAVAELDTRGMGPEVRSALVRFKRECAAALDAYFTKGVAVNPRIESAPVVDVAAIGAAVAGALVPLLERLLPAPPPAGSVVVPPAPDAYPMSQRELARRLGLPTDGEGSQLVGKWSRALALSDVEPYSKRVPIGLPGHLKEDGQLRYGEAAFDALEAAAVAARRVMVACGFTIVDGRLSPHSSTPTTKVEAARQMLEAGLDTLKVAAE